MDNPPQNPSQSAGKPAKKSVGNGKPKRIVPPKSLTKRQQKLAVYLHDPNILTKKEAFLLAGYSESVAKQQKPELQIKLRNDARVAKILCETIPLPSCFETVGRALNAKFQTKFGEVEHYGVQLQAAKMGLELHGFYDDGGKPQTNVQVNFGWQK